MFGKRRLASMFLTFVMTSGMIMTSAPPAAASAYSCTGYGWVGVPGTSLKTSRWCGETKGTGLYVSTVGGGFSALVGGVYLCDTRMKVSFFDTKGSNYRTYSSAVTPGCWQAGGVFKVKVDRTMKAGHVEISLLSYGVKIAKVRHNIKK